MNAHDPGRYSRRRFLAETGLAAGFLPLLSSRRARAAGRPRRLAVLQWANGAHGTDGSAGSFWPQADGTTWVANEVLKPLEPYKADLIICRGVDSKARSDWWKPGFPGAGHEHMPMLLTGARPVLMPDPGAPGRNTLTHNGISVDQYVANQLKAAGIADPFLGLGMAVEGKFNFSTMGHLSSTGPAQVSGSKNLATLPPETDPYRVFDRLFAGPRTDPGTGDLLRVRRKSVLDLVKRDLDAFAARLGRDDRLEIEKHAALIRSLEQALAGGSGGAGASCDKPAIERGVDVRDPRSFDRVHTILLDLAVLCFRCDAKRVITITSSDGAGNKWVYPWLGAAFDPKGQSGFAGELYNQHDIAHSRPDRRGPVTRYHAGKVAHLVAALKGLRDPDGSTLLDNTALLWINQQQDGGGHGTNNLPIVIAGRGGGHLRPGKYLQFKGAPHNGVLVALANAVLDRPIEFFGHREYGGELPGLSS